MLILSVDIIQKNRFKLEDSLVSMKKTVAKALLDWKMMLTKLDANKREDRQKSKSYSSDVHENSQVSTFFQTSEPGLQYHMGRINECVSMSCICAT